MNNTESSEIAEVSTFDVLEENFHEFTGLIYDGAFSEHLTSSDKKGLTGEEIDEETAKQKAEEFIGKDKIKNTPSSIYLMHKYWGKKPSDELKYQILKYKKQLKTIIE